MDILLPRYRWLLFNAVGALGFCVQFATLALLIRGLGVYYLLATILAVEAALVHNFVWHRRWTWRDRPAKDVGSVLRQLGRFHMVNGVVSLAGNMAVMLALTGGLRWDPLAAHLIAVLICSTINYIGSDRLVFRAATAGLAGTLVLASAAPLAAGGDGAPRLEPATLEAWHAYERSLDARYAGRHGSAFFAHDEFGRDPQWRPIAQSGKIPVFRTSTPGRQLPEPEIPAGRVHHWVGAVFVPGVSLDQVLRHLQDRAGREADAYEDVVSSRLISRNGDHIRVFMKLRRESVVTVVYNTEHDVRYRRLTAERASSRSVATRIAELADAGGAGEREKPAGQDHGFLWRLNAYWRYEEAPGGVLIECESVSLSRSVPMVLKPFVSRTVDRIARESLEKTLHSLRVALGAARG